MSHSFLDYQSPEDIYLWKDTGNDAAGVDSVRLCPFLLKSGEKFPAVIVCPGGGYGGLSNQEGPPVAGWLNSIGISAFVLQYRINPHRHPMPYHDIRRAIQHVRYHADALNIDPDRIGVIGFSAGGHLAGTVSTHFKTQNRNVSDDIEAVSARPDLSILCYGVLTFGEHRHDGSMRNLLGQEPDPDLRQSLSLENAVSPDTPPTFLWHTANDGPVPVENTYLYASALSKHKIPHEVHVFPDGAHGIGLASIADRRQPEAKAWRPLCETWLLSQGF